MPRDSGLRSFLAWLLGERVFEYTMSLCEHGSCRNPPCARSWRREKRVCRSGAAPAATA